VDPINPARSRSLSVFDARHRLAFSEYWRIPDFNDTNWSRHLVNGWALSSIVTVQSGFPIRLTSQNDQELLDSFNFETAGEPEQIAPFHRLQPQNSGGYYFNPASFTNGPLGQIGNAPRTICCGPGISNVDFAVHKAFPAGEGKNLEFRTEFFNAFNHTQFFNPDGNFSDGSAFGQVSQARDPRLIQIAMKLSF